MPDLEAGIFLLLGLCLNNDPASWEGRPDGRRRASAHGHSRGGGTEEGHCCCLGGEGVDHRVHEGAVGGVGLREQAAGSSGCSDKDGSLR